MTTHGMPGMTPEEYRKKKMDRRNKVKVKRKKK